MENAISKKATVKMQRLIAVYQEIYSLFRYSSNFNIEQHAAHDGLHGSLISGLKRP